MQKLNTAKKHPLLVLVVCKVKIQNLIGSSEKSYKKNSVWKSVLYTISITKWSQGELKKNAYLAKVFIEEPVEEGVGAGAAHPAYVAGGVHQHTCLLLQPITILQDVHQ